MKKKPQDWNFEDIHNQEKNLVACRKKFLDSDVSEENKKLVIEFIEERTKRKKLKPSRQARMLFVFRTISPEFKKPFSEATKEDVLEVSDRIKNSTVIRKKKVKIDGETKVVEYDTDKPLSEHTIHTDLIILKTFFKWLKKKNYVSWDVSELDEDMEIPNPKPKRLTRNELITWKEAVRLSKGTGYLVHKTFVQVLWDSACRATEILSLRIKDVDFIYDNSAAYLHIWKSKNQAGVRDILIIDSAPILIEYMEKHPLRDNPDAPLWLSVHNNKPATYNSMRKMLIDTAKRIGFEKPVNMHTFRKSETSERDDLTDAETKARHGWVQGSRMLNVYRHPDLKNADRRLLAKRGILPPEEIKEEKNSKVVPIRCRFCGKINPAGERSCSICKRELDPSAATKNILELQELDRKWIAAKKHYRPEADNIIDLIASLIEKVETLEKEKPKKLEVKTPA